MKVRENFVSNSSSSSFIIRFLYKPNLCPKCKRKDYLRFIFSNQDGYSDEDVMGEDINHYINRLKEDLLDYEEEDAEYDEMMEEIKELEAFDPEDLKYISIPYSASFIKDLLNEAVDNGDIEIIRDLR